MATKIATGDGDLKTAIETILVQAGWSQDAIGTCELDPPRNYTWITYKSTGESGAEDLCLGLAYINPEPGGAYEDYRGLQLYMMEDSPPSGCCITPWAVGGISGTVPDCATGASRGIPTIPLGPGDDDDGALGRYWLTCDKDALVIIARVDLDTSNYQPGYVGLLSRYQPPASDCRPALVIAGGPWAALSNGCYGGNWPFSQGSCPQSADMIHLRSLADTGWQTFKNTTTGYPQPGPSANYLAVSKYMNRCNQPWGLGGGRSLMPISVAPGYDPSGEGMRGRFRNIWHVSNLGLEEEAILTVGGNDYKVFPPPEQYGPVDDTLWIAIRWYE